MNQTAPECTGLKDRIIESLWTTVDEIDFIESATLAGSFLIGDGLGGISDIDLILIVDELNQARFDELHRVFESSLTPILQSEGFKLRINPTLGPLKFNDDDTAVLHMMLYSHAAHVDHVIKSPFTCLDWQRSTTYRKRSMADVYPVFGLQPHHFVSSRRSISDYLKDYRARVVSYRQLIFEGEAFGYTEKKLEKPMTTRDEHEFAYHVLRFLMQNVLKLIHRSNRIHDGEDLLEAFFAVFPKDRDRISDFYRTLSWKKKNRDFSCPVSDLAEQLDAFVVTFESQFLDTFVTNATRHVLFRHARTAMNRSGDELLFLGRSNPDVEDISNSDLEALLASIASTTFTRSITSPLTRCHQSLQRTIEAAAKTCETTNDERLIEIDYGQCEGLTVTKAREEHPELFDGWQQGLDPAFPDGESTTDVAARAFAFIDDILMSDKGPALVCTHNVVLRCIVGKGLGVPQDQWYRLKIPHLAPIHLVQTKADGWFLDLEEHVEREIFSDFA